MLQNLNIFTLFKKSRFYEYTDLKPLKTLTCLDLGRSLFQGRKNVNGSITLKKQKNFFLKLAKPVVPFVTTATLTIHDTTLL